jgi:hypothetical protein
MSEAASPPAAVAPGLGPWWSPVTWWRMIVAKWRAGGPMTADERRGYRFWMPVLLVGAAYEILGALSATVRDKIPWPTISDTVGHLEKRWDWVAVIVVGVIAAAAFHAVAERAQAGSGGVRAQLGDENETSIYNSLLVAGLTIVAVGAAIAARASKYELGYVLYGVLGFFGLLVPSIMAFWFHKKTRLPTLFTTVEYLRRRFHSVALILVAGLSILVIHLAFYPWPDIAHESASYAGLNPASTRARAEGKLKSVRAGKAPIPYSTQSRGVFEGQDAWFVYFRAQGCFVTVTKKAATASDDCKR